MGFDPEGLLSSVTTVVASLFGAHIGRTVFEMPRDEERLMHWLALGTASLAVGLLLHLTGALPMNTDLYSPSFLLVTNGSSLLGFIVCYFVTDVKKLSFLDPFKWLGMNGILIYLLACSGITEYAFAIVYYDNKDWNLANIFWPTGIIWGPSDDDWIPPSSNTDVTHQARAVMCWCLFAYIPVMILVAFVLHRMDIYFKV